MRHRAIVVERNLQIIRDNLAKLEAFFLEHGTLFVWQSPSAGPIAFPKLLHGRVNDFCDALMRHAGVLLLPGTLYGDTNNAFRIGFGRKNLPECLSALSAYLED